MQRDRRFVARHSAPSRTLRTRSVVTLAVAATGLATAVWLPTRFDRADAAQSTPTLVPVFADEFDGARGDDPDAAKWSADGQGVRLDGDGNVAIFARPGRRDRSADAGVQTKQTFQAAAGKVEARVRVADGESVRSVFRMLGADDSRLDVMDNRGNRSKVLRGSFGADVDGQLESEHSLAADFHSYAVTWSFGEVIWTIDDREFLRTKTDLDEPFAVALEVTAGEVDRDRTARRMLVDFVRVSTAAPEEEEPPASEEPSAPPAEEPPAEEPPAEQPPAEQPPAEQPPAAEAWEPFHLYTAGTKVEFKGVTYEVLSTHTSLPGWEPTAIPELFKAQ
ncbi:carbohydrate-binding protein [Actinoplanes sp. NPDC051470]|uniref:carbohydrate-binding protein n=1 Tax=Actinoplanes sp. NPDC051470 TaxID=3157224 RepID=UPI00343EEA2B